MPEQKPGRSKQDYATPRDLITAIERRFGPIAIDLAAHQDNHVVDRWLGPGGERENSLDVEWHKLPGLLYLNPPFGRITPWAKKAAREWQKGARIVMLVPASVSTNWFADHLEHRSLVVPFRPRIKFVGHEKNFPKDLMLCIFDRKVGFETWRWC